MARQMKTMDGNTAAAYASYAFTEVATIYPITPSSTMADVTDIWATQGKKNIFGSPVKLVELQSEGGASGAFHGSLIGGAFTTTYTASQGLLLMIPNMYKVAGELLPGVINVSARALASHALSIFGDHQDIYACRSTGFAMLCSSSVQEAMDLGAVAHLAAIEGRVPFLHFFDGFRTSHELQKIEVWDYDELKDMVNWDAVKAFRDKALLPENPMLYGSAQNADTYFQAREACNLYYDAIPAVVEKYMNMVNERIGTDYKPFNYYGAPDAERVIIAMGSVNETIEETVDYLLSKGEKVGVVKVRLYRPFSAKHLIDVIPDTVKYINVIDRTKEPGAIGEPLYIDVVTALNGSKFKDVTVLNGRYGLAGKNTTPGDICAIFNNTEKKGYTVGIVDDLTGTSLEKIDVSTAPEGTTQCKFWGLGADGTVGANKNSIKIIGDHTNMYAQAFFDYDSKKSGGVTMSHLRFGKKPIKSTYLIEKADFVACHSPAYLTKYDMVQELKDGGTFLLNAEWSADEIADHLPGQVKRFIAEHNINFYIIDGIKIGKEIGLGKRINTVLQSAFFKLANIIPEEDAIKYMKEKALASYAKKGDDIVQMNYNAIDQGAEKLVKIDVPEEWKNCPDDDFTKDVNVVGRPDAAHFVNTIQKAVNACKGDSLTVADFKEYADGRVPQGTAMYEKRGVAVDVPVYSSEGCVQCNQCAIVCPHAAIRPVVMTEEEAKNAPEGMDIKPLNGMPGYFFSIVVSVEDCLGCNICVVQCPGNKKNEVLKMHSLEERLGDQKYFDYALSCSDKPEIAEKFPVDTVKGSQFAFPYLEFSGACAGCGETPYAKLITQMYGDKMVIANATGCSSIWGGSSPSTPYTINKKGMGPAWGNSLFEDTAEYGFGMSLARDAVREQLSQKLAALRDNTDNQAVKDAIDAYKDTYTSTNDNAKAAAKLIAELEAYGGVEAEEILKEKNFLSKKSQWVIGGDGWAYDIGYGGVDHVLAQNKDVNLLVLDTEVYSNTGGQASKATRYGAIAQFAAGGKDVKKKDLASICMSYGYIYVAQVALGANMNQCIKAIKEAESYDGPSIIIAYAPCIAHGIRKGMGYVMEEEKLAVDTGYWNLFRYDPRRKQEGKNPLQVDSKAASKPYADFLMGENRYINLKKTNPERAEELFAKQEEASREQYDTLKKLSEI